jgi:hypothetical protein
MFPESVIIQEIDNKHDKNTVEFANDAAQNLLFKNVDTEIIGKPIENIETKSSIQIIDENFNNFENVSNSTENYETVSFDSFLNDQVSKLKAKKNVQSNRIYLVDEHEFDADDLHDEKS